MTETDLQGFCSDVLMQILETFRRIRWLCLWISSICGRLLFATEKCIVKCHVLPLNSFLGLPSLHRSFLFPLSVFPHPPDWVRHPSYPSSVWPLFSIPGSVWTTHVAEEVLPLFPQRRLYSSRLDGSLLAPPFRLAALDISLHPSSARLHATTTLQLSTRGLFPCASSSTWQQLYNFWLNGFLFAPFLPPDNNSIVLNSTTLSLRPSSAWRF